MCCLELSITFKTYLHSVKFRPFFLKPIQVDSGDWTLSEGLFENGSIFCIILLVAGLLPAGETGGVVS